MAQTPEHRRYIRLAGSMNVKAARLGRTGTVTAYSLAEAFVDSGGACPYCSVGISPMHCSFDHYIPFDQGGVNTPDNILACCMSCQRSKGRKTPAQFAEARQLGQRQCEVCGTPFRPRWADWARGFGRTCSRSCAGRKGGMADAADPVAG